VPVQSLGPGKPYVSVSSIEKMEGGCRVTVSRRTLWIGAALAALVAIVVLAVVYGGGGGGGY
jgi:hypothetical protein